MSDDGTNSRDDGLRVGDVLVSSHCDETRGVAKVDVSNMNYYTSFITFPIHPSLTHIYPKSLHTGNNHQPVRSSSQGSYGYHCHSSSKQGTISHVEPIVIQKISENWQ